jgi:hypothetical protein
MLKSFADPAQVNLVVEDDMPLFEGRLLGRSCL